jgi:hypothetical protein
MDDLGRLDEGYMPFRVAVEVETLDALLSLFVRFWLSVDVYTTSRTFSGGALIMIEVWSVALNQDMFADSTSRSWTRCNVNVQVRLRNCWALGEADEYG